MKWYEKQKQTLKKRENPAPKEVIKALVQDEIDAADNTIKEGYKEDILTDTPIVEEPIEHVQETFAFDETTTSVEEPSIDPLDEIINDMINKTEIVKEDASVFIDEEVQKEEIITEAVMADMVDETPYVEPILDEPVLETNDVDRMDDEDDADRQLDEMLAQAASDQVIIRKEQMERTLHTNEVTTIGNETNLVGNIETLGHLTIYGGVKGSVTCEGNLIVYGKIEGPIQCASARFENAEIIGNIHCSGKVELADASQVNGDIHAFTLSNGGQIHGNVDIAETAEFMPTSSMNGNIEAGNIEIKRGASIKGNINTRQDI